MNRKTTRIIAFIIILAMVLTSFSFVFFLPGVLGMDGYVVYGATTSAEDQKKLDSELKSLQTYMKYIRGSYKDVVDYQTLIDGAFTGVTQSLNDPFSEYFSDAGEGENFTETVNGDYEGVGITMEMADGLCRVVSATKGGPADKAGIKSGDIIKKIDGKAISGLTLSEMSTMLRGKAGTKVTVLLDRQGKEISCTITRAKIKQECVTYELLENKVGYISMSGFDGDADLEFRKAHIALANKGAEGYIIDLRDNPGGLVGTCLLIADQILGSGNLVCLRQQGQYIETLTATAGEKMTEPIVLLINEGSASASEILAGALQDNKAATLVGTTSYGKGVAQEVRPLENGKSAKLSVFYFTTPNKKEIDKVGITPDYVVRNVTGKDTTAEMTKYKTFAPMSETVTAMQGSTGLNVYGAQQRLAFLGAKVTVTGTMDTATVNAVKIFQKEAGITVNGALDTTTLNKLEQTAYEYASGTSAEDLQLKKAKELVRAQIKKIA